MSEKVIKEKVGVIIWRDNGKVFLMTSPKWKKGMWIVPGGGIEPGETEEQALRREIHEELNIELDNIVEVERKIKPVSDDFTKEANVEFHFIDFYAHTNDEISAVDGREVDQIGWFTIDEALKLQINDTMRAYLLKFKDWWIERERNREGNLNKK